MSRTKNWRGGDPWSAGGRGCGPVQGKARGERTRPPSMTQSSAWIRLTTLLLNATLLLVSAPPRGTPSTPLCLSVKRPMRSVCDGVSDGAPGRVGSNVSGTSRTTGSNGSELDASSSGTRRRRWTGRDDEASALLLLPSATADAGAAAAEADASPTARGERKDRQSAAGEKGGRMDAVTDPRRWPARPTPCARRARRRRARSRR